MTDAPFDPSDPLEVGLAARVRAWSDRAVVPIDALEIARNAASAPVRGGFRGRLRSWHGPGGVPTTERTSRRRTSVLAIAVLTLLSALAVIGSGLLLVAGQRTIPAPHMVDPLAGLKTEVVAPGVERLLGDSAGHDLTSTLVHQIAFGPDGAAWLLSERGLLRLGEPGTMPDEDGGGGQPYTGVRGPYAGGLLVAADGTVWATRPYHPTVVSSFDGRAWTDHPNPTGFESFWLPAIRIALLPDGNLLAAWGGDDQGPPIIGRFDGGSWAFEDGSGWPAALAGALDEYSTGMAVTDDGALWVAAGGGLLRYQDGAWDEADAPFTPESLAAGPDGALWIASHYRFDSGPPPPLRLARFDGIDWEVWTAPDDFEPGIMYWDENILPLVVGSDGSAWIRMGRDGRAGWSERRCDGVGRFDGSTWSTYLPGACILDIEPAADGSVWVSTYHPEAAVYRIHVPTRAGSATEP